MTIAVAIFAALDWLWILGWMETATNYHGTSFTDTTIVVSAAFSLGTVCLWVCAHRWPSRLMSLAFHWVVAVWITWYGFPLDGRDEPLTRKA